MDHVEAVRMFTVSASLQDRRPVGLARIRCLFRAHPINIGEICCSDEVQGRKAEEWLKGACME